jgi:hypothetical protein
VSADLETLLTLPVETAVARVLALPAEAQEETVVALYGLATGEAETLADALEDAGAGTVGSV